MTQTFLRNSGKTGLDHHHKQCVQAKRPTFKSRDRPMFKQRHCFVKIPTFPRIALKLLTINQTCTTEISLLLISAIDNFFGDSQTTSFQASPSIVWPSPRQRAARRGCHRANIRQVFMGVGRYSNTFHLRNGTTAREAVRLRAVDSSHIR